MIYSQPPREYMARDQIPNLFLSVIDLVIRAESGQLWALDQAKINTGARYVRRSMKLIWQNGQPFHDDRAPPGHDLFLQLIGWCEISDIFTLRRVNKKLRIYIDAYLELIAKCTMRDHYSDHLISLLEEFRDLGFTPGPPAFGWPESEWQITVRELKMLENIEQILPVIPLSLNLLLLDSKVLPEAEQRRLEWILILGWKVAYAIGRIYLRTRDEGFARAKRALQEIEEKIFRWGRTPWQPPPGWTVPGLLPDQDFNAPDYERYIKDEFINQVNNYLWCLNPEIRGCYVFVHILRSFIGHSLLPILNRLAAMTAFDDTFTGDQTYDDKVNYAYSFLCWQIITREPDFLGQWVRSPASFAEMVGQEFEGAYSDARRINRTEAEADGLNDFFQLLLNFRADPKFALQPFIKQVKSHLTRNHYYGWYNRTVPGVQDSISIADYCLGASLVLPIDPSLTGPFSDKDTDFFYAE